MGRSRSQPSGFMAILSSPWTLLPFMFGLTVGFIFWLFAKPAELIGLPIVIGLLISAGAVSTQLMLRGPAIPRTAVGRLRLQLLDCLEAGNAAAWKPCQSAEGTGTPARIET